MLKRAKSPQRWRAHHCHYLASRYADALICSTYNDEEGISSAVLSSITGEHIAPFQRVRFEEALLKLPSKDRAPLTSKIVRHNAKFLCQLFGLLPQMQPVIEFLILLNANAGLLGLTASLIDDDIGVLERMLQQKALLDIEVIQGQLSVFKKYQMIDETTMDDPHGLLFPPSLVSLLVTRRLTSAVEFLAPILNRSAEAQFNLSQFGHVNTALLANYLTTITKGPTTGVNILLYGKAGTGKTELARTLAKTVNRCLLEVKSDPVFDNRYRSTHRTEMATTLRLAHLNLLQGLLAGGNDSLLLVDECEALFAQVDEQYSKERLMHTLEQNQVPAIWITNHVDLLEPSFIRRFKLVMEVPVPDEPFAYALCQQLLSPLRVSKDFRLALAAKTNITPAIVGNAVHVAMTLKVKGAKAETLLDEVIGTTLDACGEEGSLPKYQGELPFDNNMLNFKLAKDGTDTNNILKSINHAIEQALPVRVILSGPPGTGKTAWVHHLAESHGYELLHIKCSDVLSKYVGESEQNIARLFNEASKQQKLILIDEVDSLLSKRDRANALHEIQLVNELLSQLECNTVPVFAATNALANIDSAVMRRFDFKLVCDYLTIAQRQNLFRQTFGIKRLTNEEITTLSTLNQLTPGDFAILARRQRFEPKRDHRAIALALLSAENDRKQVQPRIGFIR
ncbi:AAA family ATPase [Shewanella sp. NIFS-20-20]|uniref:AAA family ATPase n=1 Tax=Shewanella sp. NIFS-20-20 TaxID=2853806 RepID=UPI001C44A06E|nr:AAA family ATPase [Shewanella sp. NIFS-20-20]MBV7317005.1 AAA family ATPase [Shewanella sp. NIFS-20-20]